MRHKSKFSGLGQYCYFRLTFTGQCCHLKCSPVVFGAYVLGLALLPLLEASVTHVSWCDSTWISVITSSLRQSEFLGAFADLRTVTTTFVLSHWTDFREIWYVSIFRTSFKKIQVWSKFGKNFGYFTWRPVCTDDNIPLNSSQNEKCFTQKL